MPKQPIIPYSPSEADYLQRVAEAEPLAAITDDEIDRLLGCVLTYSDESFNEALKLGFGSAIRREWAWREKRGESLANLRPFAALIKGDNQADLP